MFFPHFLSTVNLAHPDARSTVKRLCHKHYESFRLKTSFWVALHVNNVSVTLLVIPMIKVHVNLMETALGNILFNAWWFCGLSFLDSDQCLHAASSHVWSLTVFASKRNDRVRVVERCKKSSQDDIQERFVHLWNTIQSFYTSANTGFIIIRSLKLHYECWIYGNQLNESQTEIQALRMVRQLDVKRNR